MKVTQMLLVAIALIGVAHGLPLAGPSPEGSGSVIPDKADIDAAAEKAKTAGQNTGAAISDAVKDAAKSIEGFFSDETAPAERTDQSAAGDEPIEKAKDIAKETGDSVSAKAVEVAESAKAALPETAKQVSERAAGDEPIQDAKEIAKEAAETVSAKAEEVAESAKAALPEAAKQVSERAAGDEPIEDAKEIAKKAAESVSAKAEEVAKSAKAALPEAARQVSERAAGDEPNGPLEKAIEFAKSDDLIEPESPKEEKLVPDLAPAVQSEEILPKIEENDEAVASSVSEDAKKALPVDSEEPKLIEEVLIGGASEGLRSLEAVKEEEVVAANEDPKKAVEEEAIVTEEKVELTAEKQEPISVAEYASRGANIAEERIEEAATVAEKELPKDSEAAAEAALPKSIAPSGDEEIAAKSVIPIEQSEVAAPEISGKSEAVAPIAEEEELAENEGKSLIVEAKETVDETRAEGEKEVEASLGVEAESIKLEKRLEDEPSALVKNFELPSEIQDIAEKGEEKIYSEEPLKLTAAEALTQTEQQGQSAAAAAAGLGNEESAQAGVRPSNSSEESSEEDKSGADKTPEKSDEESSEEEQQEKKL